MRLEFGQKMPENPKGILLTHTVQIVYYVKMFDSL